MEVWRSILGWGSPIGLGVFLVCFGAFLWLLKKAGR